MMMRLPVTFALDRAGMVTNKNAVSHDALPPRYPSGVRIGTPALTTRGMGGPEMASIAAWISAVAEHCKMWPLPEE